MLFFLGWVSLTTSQRTKYLKAFRAFCSPRAFKSRLLKELVPALDRQKAVCWPFAHGLSLAPQPARYQHRSPAGSKSRFNALGAGGRTPFSSLAAAQQLNETLKMRRKE